MEKNVRPEILAARAKLKERMAPGRTPAVGKGTARRKAKKTQKINLSNDKKVSMLMKKISATSIGEVDQVFAYRMEASSCMVFAAPKLYASLHSNTFIVVGDVIEKEIDFNELFKGLRHMHKAQGSQSSSPLGKKSDPSKGAEFGEERVKDVTDELNSEVPNLVDNFEDISDDGEE